MNKYITNPLGNIPVSKKSHVYGWSSHWSNLLNATINHKCDAELLDANVIYLDLGVNFNGSLNLFGGLNNEIYKKFNTLLMCQDQGARILCLDHQMPDFGEMFAKRIGNSSTCDFITESWCKQVSKMCYQIPSYLMTDLTHHTGITIGDSHSIAFAKKNDMILRMDGKTLYGALYNGDFNSFFDSIDITDNIERITFCFGSVDIRHHILRRNYSFKNIVSTYLDDALKISDKYNIKVEIATPVPVEFEDRRIPKTGYYKDTPFYGSQQQRAILTKQWIEFLKYNYENVVQPPEYWYEMDPELYAKQIMEQNSSVHIAPMYYRRNDWGDILDVTR